MKTVIEDVRAEMLKLLDSPAFKLQERVEKLMTEHHVSSLHELSRLMENEAQVLLLQAEYLSVRAGCTGCGEHPHNDAVKAAERRGKRIRKAMGYTDPGRLPYRVPQ